MRAAACTVAVILVGSTGCGGAHAKSAEEGAVRHVVQRWTEAVARHDNRAACSLSSDRLRRSIDRHVLGEGVAGDCRTWAARWVSPRHPAAHRGAQITSVHVDGERATVNLAARGAPEGRALLVKENGRWRIDNF